jgi:hypothetical protein
MATSGHIWPIQALPERFFFQDIVRRPDVRHSGTKSNARRNVAAIASRLRRKRRDESRSPFVTNPVVMTMFSFLDTNACVRSAALSALD